MNSKRTNPGWGDYLSLGLLSASLLSLEVILLRVFGYTQWHHFAALAISLALLGFGAAGTFLVLIGKRAIIWGDQIFSWGIIGAGTGVFVVFLLNQNLEVRPLFAVWDSRQLLLLIIMNFAAFIPFFAGAIPIGQVFVRWPKATRKLYAANLFGSGMGSLAAIILLEIAPLVVCMFIIAGVIFFAAVIFCFNRLSRSVAAVASIVGLITAIIWPLLASPSLYVSDFKRLSYLKDLPDSEIVMQSPDRRGTLTLMRSDSIRTAWGLSLNWFEIIPSMDSLVIGTDYSIPLPRPKQDLVEFDFMQASLSAAPYTISTTNTVAVLGTSEGWGVPQALRQNASSIVWVELNPEVVKIGGRRWDDQRIQRVNSSPRQFLHQTNQHFDLIVFDVALSVAYSLSEETLLTSDAIAEANKHLLENGVIAIPFHLSNPPRRFQRLMTTIAAGLSPENIPAEHVLVMRSLQDAMVVIAKEKINVDTKSAWAAFAEENGFDLVWMPGVNIKETNHYNQLEEPYYYLIARKALTDEGDFPSIAQLYRTGPAADSQPYFWDSMRWSSLPKLIDQLGKQGLAFLDWGPLMLAASFCTAAILAFLLILLPLHWMPTESAAVPKLGTLIYFASLGAGYMIVELVTLQRAILVSGDSILSAAVIFGTFLIGSGSGSLLSPETPTLGSVRRIFLPILAAMVFCVLILGFLTQVLWSMHSVLQFLLIIAAVLPLAIVMGQAMPWGLRVVAGQEGRIAWAWGINGFASVLGAPLATFISMESGHPYTALAGLLSYVAAAFVAWNVVRQRR